MVDALGERFSRDPKRIEESRIRVVAIADRQNVRVQYLPTRAESCGEFIDYFSLHFGQRNRVGDLHHEEKNAVRKHWVVLVIVGERIAINVGSLDGLRAIQHEGIGLWDAELLTDQRTLLGRLRWVRDEMI